MPQEFARADVDQGGFLDEDPSGPSLTKPDLGFVVLTAEMPGGDSAGLATSWLHASPCRDTPQESSQSFDSCLNCST